ncbi:RNA-binding (RRM/RBD/RNP motifs) family protein [Actinidia rufa]|uniref:RNA-binding (RRM/RBD/RNP motifs) family protein n=1 Tax=Actinidia rufa TaxID=165716 RepID=A0A7J0H213_9ERIC|nr:RNA-binding (RRM/RBD/RNP motifs) family protein [Actinidia rufa]
MDEPKPSDFGLGSEERGEGKSPDLGFKSMELLKQDVGVELNGTASLDAVRTGKRRGKKRKRDELEAEYEAGSNGVVMNGEGLGGRVGEKRKKADDPVAMMVSEEGSDEETKLLRTVFVGNLPLKVKKKALFKEFSQFGEIESVTITIPSVPLLNNKKPRKGAVIQKKINDAGGRVHAYIVFKMEQAARASLSHNMAVGEEMYQLFSGIKDVESSIGAIQVIRDSDQTLHRLKGKAHRLERDDSPFKKLAVDLTTPDSSNKANTESESKRKRPAVAARKANVLKGGGVLKQARGKRKLESATPETLHPYKRSRDFAPV